MTEFIELVKKMRDCQNRYFRTRDKADLISSKTVEKEVDTFIREYQKPIIEAAEKESIKKTQTGIW